MIGFYRKIIRVRAEDSPNVRLALEQIKRGKKPSGETILPGVLSWSEYCKRRELWDVVQQTVSLDAQFYEGPEAKLYPLTWINRAERLALLTPSGTRTNRAMGVDSGEGGDKTSWAVVDDSGLLELEAFKTADTADIPGRTLAKMTRYKIDPKDVLFDRGGGGKQHADQLRKAGYKVRTVGFGEAASNPHFYNRFKTRSERRDEFEERYRFKNRRAEMYGLFRELLDPRYKGENEGFAIPREYAELRRQMLVMPLLWDSEGRMWLYPKDKPTPTYKGETIRNLLGCSPDELDSVVLAVFGLVAKMLRPKIG